jgi:hypothetical protein
MITSVKQTYKSSILINPHICVYHEKREMIKKCKRQKDCKAHSYRKDLKRKAFMS